MKTVTPALNIDALLDLLSGCRYEQWALVKDRQGYHIKAMDETCCFKSITRIHSTAQGAIEEALE